METINEFEHRLYKSAVVEVWQNPHDDNQFTIRPARLCRLEGVRNILYTAVGTFRLPSANDKYVVYELGQSSPKVIGVDSNVIEWVRLDALVKRNELLCHVHIKQLQLPLSTIYLKQTDKKNVILAVKVKPNKRLLDTTLPLYIHLYSNDWLALSGEGRAVADPVVETSIHVTDLQQVANLLTGYAAPTPGNQYLHHNGYLVGNLSVNEVAIGDTLALLVDKSGLGYFDIAIEDLKHFTSVLDSRGKFIIRVPDTLLSARLQNEPVDEMELYLCNTQPNVGSSPRMKGIYYSRIHPTDVRMLTHKSFSIDSQRVEALMLEHTTESFTFNAPFIRVYLRHHTSKMKQYMDGNYISDMYKLKYEDRITLMTEVAAVYDAWKPDNLEMDPHTYWQQASVNDIVFDRLKGVYSVDEVNRRARKVNIDIDAHTALLPYAAIIGGKLLCFNAEGLLVEIISVLPHSEYLTVSLPHDIVHVDCLPGIFTATGEGLDRDTNYHDQADWFDEKFYWRDVEDTEWTEAMEGINYHINAANGELTWDASHNESGRMRRSSRDGIYRNLKIEPEMLHHPIDLYEAPGPVTLLRLSRLDVYMNGRKLAEGIDYLVNYPTITITNKGYYINNPGLIDIDLFHYGVPMATPVRQIRGFIRHRVLGDHPDNLFIENRDMSVYVDGLRTTVNKLGLFENEGTVTDPIHREGGVYLAEKWPSVLSEWATKRLCHSDLTLGDKAANAVSNLIVRSVNTAPLFIEYAHVLYSPFLKRTLLRLRTDVIDPSVFGLSDAGVMAAMAPYLSELENDLPGLDLDYDLIDIHPTCNITEVDVTEEEFLFMRKVSKLYFNNRVVFNTYTTIEEDIAPAT